VTILALETSSAEASVAVARDGVLVEVRRFTAPRGRGTELFTVLEELRPLWRNAGRLALGLGPGSYNGLRVACALAGSFRLALGLELVTLPSPCLLAVDEPDFIAVGDARGSRLWRAEVRARRLHGEIRLLPPEEFFTSSRDASNPPIYRVGPILGGEDLPAASPDAALLATLGSDLEPTGPDFPEPLYLKPPHITQPRNQSR
jgi:tRNA threonylcarbamoyladenosine biosynthesis protein TsaB